MLKLRVRHSGGRAALPPLASDTSLECLARAVCDAVPELTDDVTRLRLAAGYPPKALPVLESPALTLADANVRDNDTLVASVASAAEASADAVGPTKAPTPTTVAPSATGTSQDSAASTSPGLQRVVVPADNSCLFRSVAFLRGAGSTAQLPDLDAADELRQLVAASILSQPEEYSEAVLGRPPEEYGTWLARRESWGGGIELAVLSKSLELEMHAVDVQTQVVHAFGSGQGYSEAIFLLYDGIHYDALVSARDGARRFSVAEHEVPAADAAAVALARELHAKREFTDLAGFQLRCLVCQQPLKGQREAQEHAKTTGHMNFGEV